MLCELRQYDEAHNFHHTIPRTLHSNKWFKKRYTREEMSRGLNLCKDCHKTIHSTLSEKELGRNYNTKEKLLAHPQLAKYISWKRRRIAVN